MALEHLRLEDYSDRELLLVISDLSDGDGYASSHDIADHLGIEARYPLRAVASRLMWLTRYGAIEREHARDDDGNLRYYVNGKPRFTQRWALTPEGEMIAEGALTKTNETALGKLQDRQLVLVARWLNQRSNDAGRTGATLVDREWRRGTLLKKRQ